MTGPTPQPPIRPAPVEPTVASAPPPTRVDAPADGTPRRPADVFAELAADPYRFDFFQAVRRIECAAADRPRIGTTTRAEQDPVRFRQDPSLAFAPSTVAGFTPTSPDGDPPRLAVNFIGLWGPNGPLPLHLTEYARDRQRNADDPTLVRFMDVFHHRMTSLFYRAWAATQQVVAADRSEGASDEADRFAVYVASLVGRGMPSLRRRDAVPDPAKLHWAGRLASGTAHAEGLAAILAAHFGVPCEVVPFAGQWIGLPPESRCKLGRSRDTGSLGQTAIVGASVWDCQGKFRLRLGPMSLDRFSTLLPGQRGNQELRDWIRNYAGDQLAWEARVVLAAPAVPGVRLGRAGRVGWSTWLPTTAAVPKDVDDLVLHS